MLRVFLGWDPREAIGYHVCYQSLIETSWPIAVTCVSGLQGDGTNAFTYERFRVPEMCGFGGIALFLDGSDMLVKEDVNNLARLFDPTKAVQVVKHDYRTKHPRKYVGTSMEAINEDYPRKNWSSVVLWNCGHKAHFDAREKLRGTDGKFLHRFSWLKDEEIGELPAEWNWLTDEYGHNEKAKIHHWTAGIPAFWSYHDAPNAGEWREMKDKVMQCF